MSCIKMLEDENRTSIVAEGHDMIPHVRRMCKDKSSGEKLHFHSLPGKTKDIFIDIETLGHDDKIS